MGAGPYSSDGAQDYFRFELNSLSQSVYEIGAWLYKPATYGVPEPGSIALLATGVLLVIVRRLRVTSRR